MYTESTRIKRLRRWALKRLQSILPIQSDVPDHTMVQPEVIADNILGQLDTGIEIEDIEQNCLTGLDYLEDVLGDEEAQSFQDELLFVITLPDNHIIFRYGHYSSEELEGFVKARSVVVPLGEAGSRTKIWKTRLVLALDRADRHASFRFLDLPAEMRNWVYGDLLVFSDSKKYCYPQVLATTHQVNKEASGILYGENRFQVSIVADPDDTFADNDCDYYNSWRFHVPFRISVYGNLSLIQQPERTDILELQRCLQPTAGPNPWPAFLSRAENIGIDIKLADPYEHVDRNGQPTNGDVTFCNRALYTLSCFLQDGHSLKNMEIHVNVNKEKMSIKKLEEMLYPFCRSSIMVNACKVHSSEWDLEDERLHHDFLKYLNSGSGPFGATNPLVAFAAQSKQLQDFDRLLKAIRIDLPSEEGSVDEEGLLDQHDLLSAYEKRLSSYLGSTSIITAQFEAGMRKNYDDINRLMDAFDVTKIEESRAATFEKHKQTACRVRDMQEIRKTQQTAVEAVERQG